MQVLDPTIPRGARGAAGSPRPASRPDAPRPPPAVDLPDGLSGVSKELARQAKETPSVVDAAAIERLGRDILAARTDCGLCSLAGFQALSGRPVESLVKLRQRAAKALGPRAPPGGDLTDDLTIAEMLWELTGVAPGRGVTSGEMVEKFVANLVRTGGLREGDPVILGLRPATGGQVGHFVVARQRAGRLEVFDLQAGRRADGLVAHARDVVVHYVGRGGV
ncbi:MAG: hypothetical protein M9894_13615 [Planctomycetes bacterium]|nr:hypothetical protein [Planctomycetota bacterium]